MLISLLVSMIHFSNKGKLDPMLDFLSLLYVRHVGIDRFPHLHKPVPTDFYICLIFTSVFLVKSASYFQSHQNFHVLICFKKLTVEKRREVKNIR